jgi:hypothetical protein
MVIDLVSFALGFELKYCQDSEASGNDQANANEPEFLAGDRATDGE